MWRIMNQFWFLVFLVRILKYKPGLVFCKDVPEPVGLFPLNSLHTTKDISNNYLTAGTAAGVSLAPGPDGKPGGSYYFQGSASSYILIPYQSKLDTRYSLSILFWIYNHGAEGPVFHYDVQSSAYAVHLYVAGGPSALFVRVTLRNSYTFIPGLSYDMGTVNTWRYIGYTYDYATGQQKLFVDGVKVKEGHGGQHQLSTNFRIKVGGTKYGDTRIFEGRVSCLQIYDKGLTREDVLAAKHKCVEKNEYSACVHYTPINDPTRAINYKVSGQPPDRQTFIRRRWYRLNSDAGTRIATSCPATGSCGAQSPGWLNGQYPSFEIGIKKMEICYRTGSNCCGNKAIVYVRQCYGYPVFMLDDVPDISLGNRFCTETEMIFPNAMFRSANTQCLSGHVMYAESNIKEASVCMVYCLNAGQKCKSFNFVELENGTCQINNATLTDYPMHVTMNISCRYYQHTTVVSYTIT